MASIIPIQNLYYLLCYAWGLPEQRDYVKVKAESCPSVSDLFARLLIHGAEVLLRRGVTKEYKSYSEELYGVNGKLEVSSTLKKNRIHEGLTICSMDDLTEDILLNQIVYSSMHLMLRSDIDKGVREDLIRVYQRFPRVEIIPLSSVVFNRLRLNRNNRFYRLIINVCQLIHESMLPDSGKEGEYKFVDFTRDEKKMHAIFEEFLLNFYKKECSSDYPIVKKSIIKFNLEALDEEGESLLPEMITDVTLDNPATGQRIILDAKYYLEMLTSRFDTSKKLRRDHISQIQSYLDNQEEPGVPYTFETNGIMVYPQNGMVIKDANFKHRNHTLRFCTVDLNQDWYKIDQRLKDIIRFN